MSIYSVGEQENEEATQVGESMMYQVAAPLSQLYFID